MHSFIIISKDPILRKEFIESFCKEKGIGKFDQKLFEPIDASFGVALVRDIRAAAFLKPTQSKEKLLILEDAQKLTTEAQNALLKILEEPPAHTYVILSATTDAYFLPTVLSRCKTIILEEKTNTSSDDDIFQYTSILEKLTSGSVGEKLALAETVAGNKDEISHWLTQMILFLREKMHADLENKVYPKLLKNMQEAHQLFQTTNVSPRIIIEHLVLGFEMQD